MSEIWIPISIMISFTILIGLTIFLGSKNKKEVQLTLRHMIDKGEPVTPELLSKIGAIKPTKALDFRRGIVLISIGVACLLSGNLLAQIKLAFAIAVFPIFIGIAFLLTWKLNQYDD